MIIRLALTVLLLLTLNILLPFEVIGQSTDTTEVIQYSPNDFDNWVSNSLEQRKRLQQPDLVTRLILKKLEQGYFVSDDAILWTIEAWRQYDRELIIDKLEVTIYSIEKLGTIKFIDDVLSILYKRTLLELKLREIRFGLIEGNHGVGYTDSFIDHLTHNRLLKNLKPEILISYYKSCNELGTKFLESDELEKAEALFLETLSYPFYIEEDHQKLKQLRLLYIDAGEKLLESRQGDLKALQETYFVPSAKKKLNTIKQELIKNLESKKN